MLVAAADCRPRRFSEFRVPGTWAFMNSRHNEHEDPRKVKAFRPRFVATGPMVLSTSRLKRFLLTLIPLAGMLIGLPLLGVRLAGLPLAPYFEFPPQTRLVVQAPFSWPVFCLYAIVIAAALFAVSLRAMRSWRRTPPATDRLPGRFPGWGWAAAAAGAAAWLLAWTRFPWMTLFQAHTFTPLWLAYIVEVSALCFWRTGRSLLTHRTGFFLALFPASAVFWWFFEYLNRFVQNWYYVGERFGPWEYFWYATLPFATVLPAVASTGELIRSCDGFRRAFGRVQPLSGFDHPLIPWVVLAAAGAGLALIGVWPNFLHSLVWVAPILIMVTLESIRGQPHSLRDLCRPDWSGPASAALAALVCGFFWEMWNFYSFAKWKYSIPFVQRFEIFEMPVLGYAGYLPFGLECALVAGLLENLLKPERTLPR
jgi:hypothetical protein